MATSPLAQLRALEKQKIRILDGAKTELLERIERDIGELNKLGFSYSLSTKTAGRKRVNGKRMHSGKPCSICGFATDKPHDARSHRWQKPKGPFSERELTERGLQRA